MFGHASDDPANPREVLLPTADDQPLSVQVVVRGRRPVLVDDLHVVDRRTALVHRSSCGAPRFAQSRRHEKVDDRRGSPAASSVTEASRKRRSQSVLRQGHRARPRPNSAWLASSTALVCSAPCTSVVISAASRRWAARANGRSCVSLFQLVEFFAIKEREPAQVADDIGVSGVHEVLVPGVRRGHLGVQPQASATGRLTELLAVRRTSPAARSVRARAVRRPGGSGQRRQ